MVKFEKFPSDLDLAQLASPDYLQAGIVMLETPDSTILRPQKFSLVAMSVVLALFTALIVIAQQLGARAGMPVGSPSMRFMLPFMIFIDVVVLYLLLAFNVHLSSKPDYLVAHKTKRVIILPRQQRTLNIERIACLTAVRRWYEGADSQMRCWQLGLLECVEDGTFCWHPVLRDSTWQLFKLPLGDRLSAATNIPIHKVILSCAQSLPLGRPTILESRSAC